MSKEIDPKDNANYHEALTDVEQALRSARRIEDTLPPPEELVRKKQHSDHSIERRHSSDGDPQVRPNRPLFP